MADLAELTRRFRAFAETARRRAPLYSVLARVVADDPALVGLLEAAPEEQHNPVLLFVAVHDLLLRGLGPDLAAFYPNLAPEPKTGDVAPVFRSFVSNHADQIRELVATRKTQTNEVARCSLFLPLLAQVYEECGPLAVVEVGASAGLNLLFPHYSYEYEPGGSVGDLSSVRPDLRDPRRPTDTPCDPSDGNLGRARSRRPSTCTTLTRPAGSRPVFGRISPTDSPVFAPASKLPGSIHPLWCMVTRWTTSSSASKTSPHLDTRW